MSQDGEALEGMRRNAAQIPGATAEVLDDAEYDARRLAQPLTKDDLVARLKRACDQAIRGGFVSSALGSEHRYDTDKDTDQLNLVGAGNAGRDIRYTCTEVATGIKTRRLHTAEQMAQVLADGIAAKDAIMDRLYDRLGQIAAATTLDEIEAVVW